MAITIDVKALVNDAVKNLDVVNDRIDAQDRAVNKLAKAQHDLEASALKLADAQKSLSKNTDPSKQHDLEGAVLSARVALDKQQAEVEQLARQYKNLDSAADQVKGSQGGMIQTLADVKAGVDLASQGFQVAQQALGYLKQAFDTTVIKAANWGDSMGDLAQLTGQSVEETSRLAATMELVGVDSDNLGRILKSMTKEGLNLNLETLVALNKQYNDIQDPVARNAFLFRNFGKAAEDMAEIMGRSEAELRALSMAADQSGKVIGGEAADKAEKFNVQMAIFNQQVDGAEIAVGNFALTLGITFAQAVQDATNAYREYVYWITKSEAAANGVAAGIAYTISPVLEFAQAFRDTGAASLEAAPKLADVADRMADAGTAGMVLSEGTKTAIKGFYAERDAASALSNSLAVLNAGISGGITKENESFAESQGELTKKAEELKEKIDKLTASNGKYYETVEGNGMTTAELALATQKLSRAQAQLSTETDPYKQAQLAVEIEKQQAAIAGANTVVSGYVDNSKKIGELTAEYDSVNAAIQENAANHEEAKNRIVFAMIQQQYAIDGLSEDEIAALTDIGQEMGIYDEETARIMRSVQASIRAHGTDSIAVLRDVKSAYDDIANAPNIEKSITIKTTKFGDENFNGWTPPATPSGGGSTTTTDNTQLTGVQGGYASGGSFVVPGSGSGDRPYVVNLTPGERVDVTPVGKSSGGGGGSPIVGQIVINQQPGQDAEDLARVVQRHIAKWARQKAGTGNW